MAPKKVQDKTGTYQNYITYSVVQRESISCVPPDESVATPVAPKNENLRNATESGVKRIVTSLMFEIISAWKMADYCRYG